MSLGFRDDDWQETTERDKKRIINEIANELARKHPDLFSAKGKYSDPYSIVRNAVISRSDLIPEEMEEVQVAIMGQITGYGPLAEFFTGPDAFEYTEIAINPTGPDTPPRVFYVRDGRWHESDRVYFKNNKEVEDYFRTHCENSMKQLTSENQIVHAWMKDGSRVTVIGPKVSHLGIAGNIRKSPFTRPPINLDKLVEWGMFPDFVRRLLVDVVVEGQAKLAVCGRTDTGKTTVLRSLGLHINPSDRVIIAEPSFELAFPNLPHCLNLVEVKDGKKVLVDMSDLCRVVNRSNPDHAIISEVLGREIIPANQIAASTSGLFWLTMHAGNLADFLNRVHGMYFEGGMQLDRDFLFQKIQSMFNFIVFIDKDRNKKRCMMAFYEVTGDGFRPIIEFDTAAFIESGGKKRRWIYRNAITKEKLNDLAFRGADIKQEYTEIKNNILNCEGEHNVA